MSLPQGAQPTHGKSRSALFPGLRHANHTRGMTRVLVVDDHPSVRAGLAAILSNEVWVADIFEAASLKECQSVTTHDIPNVAIVDLRLGEENDGGLKVVKHLAGLTPPCRSLVLTGLGDTYIQRSLDAGATGYLAKDATQELVVAALRAIKEGALVLPQDLQHGIRVVDPAATGTFARLTAYQLRIVQLICADKTTDRIASELGIEKKTVQNHVSTIQTKLGVRDRVGIVNLAYRENLRPTP